MLTTAALMVGLPVGSAVGAATATNTASQTAKPNSQQAASKNRQQLDEAVSNISNQLQAPDHHDRRVAVLQLTTGGHLLADLMKADRYEDVVRLSVGGILAVPSDVKLVDYQQNYRIRALLKLGRSQEALAVAKERFNFCRMPGTAAALEALVNCLRAAHPGDDAIIERLAQEQMAGAQGTNERSTSNIQRSTSNRATGKPSAISFQRSVPGLRSSVMDGIKIDGTAYENATRQYATGTDYRSLVARGNLLLLADRPREARPAFERAYAIAEDKDLADATDNIARCMKAEDGTIGRANAWIMSIRPK